MIRYLKIDIPVRYDEEDVPKVFPLRLSIDELKSIHHNRCDLDRWIATIDLKTNKIVEWNIEVVTNFINLINDDEKFYLHYGANNLETKFNFTDKTFKFSTKVCDEGFYFLLDEKFNVVSHIDEDYVPNEIIPGKYGDYIDLVINYSTGEIVNFPSLLNLSDNDILMKFKQDYEDED